MDDITNPYDEHVPTTVDDMESSYDEFRRSKRQRKEFFFVDEFYIYLIENELSSYFEVISSPLILKLFLPLTHCFKNKLLKLNLTLF